jgi:hypothetical protein
MLYAAARVSVVLPKEHSAADAAVAARMHLIYYEADAIGRGAADVAE